MRLFVRIRSGCICLRVGEKLDSDEIKKTLPLLLKFVPVDEELHLLTQRLLKKGFARFIKTPEKVSITQTSC